MSIQGTRGLHLHRQVCLRPATAFRNRVLLVPGLPPGREELRAEREEWRGLRMGPAGDHFGPLEKRPSCGGAGGGGFGEGAASGSGADDAHPRARPGHSGSSRQPGGPLGNPLRASSSRPPSLITSRLSLPSPSPPNPLLSKRKARGGARGCRLSPQADPGSALGGHGQQHGHQALLRQPLR